MSFDSAAETVVADDDDVVVLPWWQHPVNIVIVAVTAALLAGMLGWIVGRASNDVESSDVDVGFLQDMRVHHEQAIDMSFTYLKLSDTDPRLRTVARSIIWQQGVEIGLMLQLLDDMGAPDLGEEGQAMAWMGHPMDVYEMPGMASDEQLDELAASDGAEADRLFVELMTAHHEGGIDMATEAAEHAANDDVRRYAGAMARGQQAEIVELQGLVEPAR